MSRSGSKHPVRDEAPEWVGLLPREIEKKAIELAKDGRQPAQIGLVLRDQYGVPNVHQATGKKLGQILSGAGLRAKVPQDVTNLIRRAIALQEHLQDNRNDLHNLRGLELMESRIRSLILYYQAKGLLAADFKYTRDGARLLVD